MKPKLLSLLVLLGGIVFLGAGCTANKKTTVSPPPPGGAYVSNDSGNTWFQIASFSGGGNITNVTPLKVVFDPFESTTIYMATGDTGLLRFTKEKGSWEQLKTPALAVNGVVIHPRNPNIVYIFGNSEEAAKRSKVWKSYDKGISWQEIYSDPLAKKAGVSVWGSKATPSYVTALDIDQSRPEVVIVGSSSGALNVSTDGGATWKNAYSFSQAVSGIKANPRGGEWFILLSNGSLVSTRNEGKTVEKVKVKAEGVSPSAILSMQFGVGKNESESIYLSTDRGVFRTDDGGDTWELLPLPISEKKSVSVKALGIGGTERVYAGSNYILYISKNSGKNWKVYQFPISNAVSFILVNPENPDTLYAFFSPR